MNYSIMLQSEFSLGLRKKNRAHLFFIMGKPMCNYIISTCERQELPLLEKNYKFEDKEEEFLIVSASTPTAADEIVFDWIHSEENVFYNLFNELVAFKVKASQLPMPMDFGQTFENLANSLGIDLLIEDDSDNFIYDVDYVNDFYQFSRASKELQLYHNAEWMQKGVRIDDPNRVRIDLDCEIGEGTWIQGACEIEKGSKIGEDCFIKDGSRIVDSTIGNRVEIKSSLIESSIMEDDSNIGPYAHLRPKAHIGKKVHIGNFVEVKNAILGEGTKAGHLAYIGDADVGENVNISCGVIFANYDGKKKHRTSVGNNAFIGSNVNLVAPVDVEDEGYIAAGSTITKTVKAGSLALERSEERCIEGYVQKRKDKGLL